MALRFRCPDCRKTFSWPNDKPWPDECQVCGNDMRSERKNDGVVMPFISSAKMKSIDSVYKQMEQGSERRMEIAAEMTGAPVADMSALKITNMNDRQREGDIAIPEVTAANNAVMAHMEQTKQTGFQNNGAGYAAGVADGAVSVNGQVVRGIEPRAGARTAQSIQRLMGR